MNETYTTTQGPQNLPIVSRLNKELRPALEMLKPELAAVLPAHITPEAMVRMAITACQDTPKLLECDRTSLFRAVMTAAVLGLEVDSKIGLAYILPFYDRGGYKAQFIPGYKGYITLAQNAGFYVSGNVVREGDEFDFEYGSRQYLRHKVKDPFSTGQGEIIGAYAIAKNPQGVEIFKVMGLPDMHKARAASASYKAYMKDPSKKTPWIDNPAPMYIKTAIRALAPQLPTNVQRAAAIEGHHENTGHAAYILPDIKNGKAIGDDIVMESDDQPSLPTYNAKDQPDIMSEVGADMGY